MKLSNEHHNLFDIVFKLTSGIFILVAFLIGLNQFKFQSELEFKKIYFTNQVSYINDLIEVTSKLCHPFLEAKEEASLIKNFRSLYYGKKEAYLDESYSVSKKLIEEIDNFKLITKFIENDETEFNGGATNDAAKKSAKEISNLAKKYVDEIYNDLQY